jgi:hypothetical protein
MNETYIWGILSIFIPIFIIVLLFVNVGKIYDYNLRMKNENPFLFKIIGMNEKYLADKSAWVKHQRVYIVLISLLLLCIMVPIVMLF